MNIHRTCQLIAIISLSLGLVSCHELSSNTLAETPIDDVLACEPVDVTNYPGDDSAAFQASLDTEKAALAARMHQSESADDQVVAVAAFAPRHARLSSLQVLAEKFPDNTLLALQVLKNCISDISVPGCGMEVTDKVSKLDGDNAFAWALIAKYRSLQEDDYGVLAALRKVASAAVYNDYFREQMGILNQSIPNDNSWLNHGLRLDIINIALEATLLSHNVLLTPNCAAKVTEQTLLADYCLTLGSRVTNESGVMLHQKLGLALQEGVYTRIGDYSSRYAVQDKRYNLSTSEQIGAGDSGVQTDRLLYRDQALGKMWIETFINEGEIQARDLLAITAQAKIGDADKHYCSP